MSTTNNKKPVLYIIIPCYNEQEVLPITSAVFLSKIKNLVNKRKISRNSRILYVNDGSKDKTWNIIEEMAKNSIYIEGCSLSRNRGHQNALLAGLVEAKDRCDISVSIDCDGQDDINAIDEMIEMYSLGNDIVYGVRKARDKDSFFKKNTAELYYKMLSFFGVEVVFNHADYRLLSSKVLNELANYNEVNLFLRGLIPLIGFQSACVYYDRDIRAAGSTHYPLKKMFGLAINGITGLSDKPINFIIHIGFFVSLIGLIITIAELMKNESFVQILLGTIIFIMGIQFISIGVIGIYVGKTYMESKHRPRFIISRKTYE